MPPFGKRSERRIAQAQADFVARVRKKRTSDASSLPVGQPPLEHARAASKNIL